MIDGAPKQADGSAKSFDLNDLDYDLSEELIAQGPSGKRDAARMLVVNRTAGEIRDGRIGGLVDCLRTGDVLVINDTRVIPARFFLRRATGGRIEGLFLEEPSRGTWRVLLKGAGRIKEGETVSIDAGDDEEFHKIGFRATKSEGGGQWTLEVRTSQSAIEILDRVGQTPLPPYIRRGEKTPGGTSPLPGHSTQMRVDRERYQTVYAKHAGAVAAPTAGLHFTEELLDAVRTKGVQVVPVTLHVGLGTFKPIEAESIDKHRIHTERYHIPAATAAAVNVAGTERARVVAVGTTSVRTLESAASEDGRLPEAGGEGSTGLFIYPPYRFRVVDALLTNFHLPRSTLLALVMAFAGTDLTRRAYAHAIAHRYRFYSYGDAMFIE